LVELRLEDIDGYAGPRLTADILEKGSGST
jgi:hypothetical protein